MLHLFSSAFIISIFISFFVKSRMCFTAELIWEKIGSCTHWCEVGWYSSPAFIEGPDGEGVIVGSAYSIYALDVETGEELWKVSNPAESRTWAGIIALKNFPTKGEIGFVSGHGGGYVCAWSFSGERLWCTKVDDYEVRSVSAAKLKKDDDQYYIMAGISKSSRIGLLHVLDSSGSVIFSRPREDSEDIEDGSCYNIGNDNIATMDLNGDGNQEIILPCDTCCVTIFDHNGDPWPSNPKYTVTNNEEGIWGNICWNRVVEPEERGWGHDDLRPNFHWCPATPIMLDNNPKIVMPGYMHDIESNKNVKYGIFMRNPDFTRFVDEDYGADWSLPFDNGNYIADSYNTIATCVSDLAAVDITGNGYPEFIYSSNDGYVHCLNLDKSERWKFKVTNTDVDIRFSSPVSVFYCPNTGAITTFSSWGMEGKFSNGYIHFLDIYGRQIYSVTLPVGNEDGPNGATNTPTLFKYAKRSDNIFLTLQTMKAGNVLYELIGTEDCTILFPTARGSFLRNGFLNATNTVNIMNPMLFSAGEIILVTFTVVGLIVIIFTGILSAILFSFVFKLSFSKSK